MAEIGYVDIEEYPHEPHFIGGEFWDNSLGHAPFGEFFSLNIMARKPLAAVVEPTATATEPVASAETATA